MTSPVKVLSIDGGGIRGYLPALFLAGTRAAGRPPTRTALRLSSWVRQRAPCIGIGLATGKSSAELADFIPSTGAANLRRTDERTEWRRGSSARGADIWESLDSAARTIGGPFGGNPAMGGNARHVADGLEAVLAEVLGEAECCASPRNSRSRPSTTLVPAHRALPGTLAPIQRMTCRCARRLGATSAAPTFFATPRSHVGGPAARGPSTAASGRRTTHRAWPSRSHSRSAASGVSRDRPSYSSRSEQVSSPVARSSMGAGRGWAQRRISPRPSSVWAGEVLVGVQSATRTTAGSRYLDPRVAGAMQRSLGLRLAAAP